MGQLTNVGESRRPRNGREAAQDGTRGGPWTRIMAGWMGEDGDGLKRGHGFREYAARLRRTFVDEGKRHRGAERGCERAGRE